MANTADTSKAGKIVEVTFTGTGADWNHSTDGGFDAMYIKSIIWHPSGADDVLVVNEGGVDGPSIVHWKAYADLVSNGGFDSATTGWTAVDCTLASIAGGQVGNCLEITRTGAGSQVALQAYTTEIGKIYKASAYVKSGTSGDQAFKFYEIGEQYNISGTSTAGWVLHTVTYEATSINPTIILRKNTATAGTMLFDTARVDELPINKQIDFGEKGVPLKPYIDITDCTFSDITATKIIFILE